MSENAVCRPRRALARQGAVRVDLCGCGQVHVAIGAITVRLASADYLTRARRCAPPHATCRPTGRRRCTGRHRGSRATATGSGSIDLDNESQNQI
jgi:hypothetical protein